MASELDSLIQNQVSEANSVRIFEQYMRPALAEFFGVTLFVCVGCLAVTQSGSASAPGSVPFSGVSIALAHGLAIALLVCALGDVRYECLVTLENGNSTGNSLSLFNQLYIYINTVYNI